MGCKGARERELLGKGIADPQRTRGHNFLEIFDQLLTR
jgi:hypothetical protein